MEYRGENVAKRDCQLCAVLVSVVKKKYNKICVNIEFL